jgi:hypothetical protein
VRAVAFQQLALQIRQRGDLDGQQNAYGANTNNYITDTELGSIINGSLCEVWDVLIAAYGDNYAWGTYIIPVVQGTYSYQLPFDFYKEAGVDLALDSTGQNWASVRPYTLRDRNLFSFPLQTALAYAGWQNVRWQIQGQILNFLPQIGPLPGQVRLLYYPCAPVLVATLPTAYAASTAYPSGQLVSVSVTTNGETATQVFCALNAGTSGGSAPSWPVPGAVTDNNILWAYQGPIGLFSQTFDGISGFEELLILDATIKCLVKQEADVTSLAQQRTAFLGKITKMAANRQAGDPMVVSGGFGMCEGGPAYGNGFGPFGGY